MKNMNMAIDNGLLTPMTYINIYNYIANCNINLYNNNDTSGIDFDY